jgi:hypothetical protein
MPPVYTPNVKLAKPAVGDAQWGSTMLNPDLDTLDGLTAIGSLAVSATEVPSTTLNVRVAAGLFKNSTGHIISYAGALTFALVASATAYLYLTDTGTLTTGTAWPAAGTNFVPLAIVVTSGSAITSVTDQRLCFVAGMF